MHSKYVHYQTIFQKKKNKKCKIKVKLLKYPLHETNSSKLFKK